MELFYSPSHLTSDCDVSEGSQEKIMQNVPFLWDFCLNAINSALKRHYFQRLSQKKCFYQNDQNVHFY